VQYKPVRRRILSTRLRRSEYLLQVTPECFVLSKDRVTNLAIIHRLLQGPPQLSDGSSGASTAYSFLSKANPRLSFKQLWHADRSVGYRGAPRCLLLPIAYPARAIADWDNNNNNNNNNNQGLPKRTLICEEAV